MRVVSVDIINWFNKYNINLIDKAHFWDVLWDIVVEFPSRVCLTTVMSEIALKIISDLAEQLKNYLYSNLARVKIIVSGTNKYFCWQIFLTWFSGDGISLFKSWRRLNYPFCTTHTSTDYIISIDLIISSCWLSHTWNSNASMPILVLRARMSEWMKSSALVSSKNCVKKDTSGNFSTIRLALQSERTERGLSPTQKVRIFNFQLWNSDIFWKILRLFDYKFFLYKVWVVLIPRNRM